MKFYILLILISFSSFSQNKELRVFNEKLNFLLDFQSGKLDSVAKSKTTHQEAVHQLDESFKAYVTNENSYSCYDCRISSENENIKFFDLDKITQIVLHSFQVNQKTYVSYSYRSFHKQNYFIKDLENNKIVYQGNGKTYSIENIYEIEENYFILIEIHGDRRESREIMVLKNDNNSWKQIKGFEGKELSPYFELKYKAKRTILKFECDGIDVLNYPEINSLRFDKNLKTISFTKYIGKNKFEIISTTWKDKKFNIDDYYAYGSLYK